MKKFLCCSAPPLTMLIVWWVVTALAIVSPLLIPSPQDVAIGLIALLFTSHNIWKDLAYTLFRVFTSLAIGITIGTPIGLCVGYFPMLRKSWMPWIDFLRSVPATALLPLFLLVFGIGDASKVALAALVVTLLLVVHTTYGVTNANPTRMMVAETMRFSPLQIFYRVILPEALPYITVGIRLSISFAMIIIVVSEMFVGTRHGLGLRIIESQLIYATSDMYAAIAITGLLGYLLNHLYLFFERRIVHWAGK